MLSFLYLVRDYAGIKPLYYSILSDNLIFASEIRAFKAFNNYWEESRDWRVYFLIFGHIPEPFTVLRDVYMLPKGSFMRFDLRGGTHVIQKFDNISFGNEIKDVKEAADGVRGIFLKAIKRHLISDAPIGVFLSGGIDSSLIALASSNFERENLKTLSVVFNEKEFSEEYYQKIIVDKIGSKHRAYLISERDFIDNIDDIFSAMDQPTTDGINTYFISGCAKEEGLKAVLSGLGGDELFGGYPSFCRIDKAWFLRGVNGNLKEDVRFSRSMPKFLLTKAFESTLPRDVVFREKRGFSFPFQIWMRNNVDLLSGFVKDKSRPALKRIIDDFRNNRLHWSRFWSLVVLSRQCGF
ncbi:MAG: hypothetical protein C4291_06710 [Candidatus Dadabacteria bacterium]